MTLVATKNLNFLSAQGLAHPALPDKADLSPARETANPLQGYPLYLESELCWKPADLQDHAEKYIYNFSKGDIAKIEKAVLAFKQLGLKLSLLEPSTFPLPKTLARRLRRVSKIVHSGTGFAVLRGLSPDKYSDEDNAIAYAGIASYIGVLRSTNSKGNALDHIRNASQDTKPEGLADDQELAPSKLPDGMKFHADRLYADILSLYIKSQAAAGGEQYITSSWTMYNELMEQAPDVLETLAENWQWAAPDKLEQSAADRMPAMLHADGRVIFQLVWQPFVKNPELASPEQLRALATVQHLAEKNSVKLDQQPGDIQLINNLAILHTRSKFTDSPSQKRHLLRLGLRDPSEAWSFPDRYAALFEEPFATPMESQTIPVTDFDAWDKTTTEDANHG